MTDSIDLSKPSRTIHAGVILTGGITEILDVAPIDFLSSLTKGFTTELPDIVLSKELRDTTVDIQFHWVTEHGDEARLTCGVNIAATDSFKTCPSLDIALMGAHNFMYKTNEAELEFIRKTYESCAAFITICGGFQPLLESGLLEGKRATGPRPLLDMLRQNAPGTTWLEKRWVRDGKIWTSGALLNGLDLMRAFATEYWGDKLGTLSGNSLSIGAWPIRDVDYNDAE